MIKDFDDFLNIKSQQFDNIRYLMFFGNSGSGKSTNIQYLLKHHLSYKNNKKIIIRLSKNKPSFKELEKYDLLIFDEIYNFFDFIVLLKYISLKKKFIIASHVSPIFYSLFSLFGRTQKKYTDKDSAKIKRYLKKKKYSYTEDVINEYMKKYGATYTDIDIIVEKKPSKDFSEIYYNFHKLNSIKLD